MSDLFRTYAVDVGDDLFADLRESARFEQVGKGRMGAVLVRAQADGRVPLVRTTSRYELPAQHFAPVHQRLAQQIVTAASLGQTFNNALFEHYTNAYGRMGFHSDQSLDLEPGTEIAILSCYAHEPSPDATRMLVVESKTGDDRFELPLEHNSAVIFSLVTNRRFKHKIVLDRGKNPPDNEWLGLTFRTSKTFVRYGDTPILDDGTQLTLANEDQERRFFQLRSRENSEPDFDYPTLGFTLSASDLVAPSGHC